MRIHDVRTEVELGRIGLRVDEVEQRSLVDTYPDIISRYYIGVDTFASRKLPGRSHRLWRRDSVIGLRVDT